MQKQAARRLMSVACFLTAVSAVCAMGLRTTSAQEQPKPSGTFEVYQDRAGEYRWRLLASNKQVIATSGDGYKEKRSCLEGIESVKRVAAAAKVEEAPAK